MMSDETDWLILLDSHSKCIMSKNIDNTRCLPPPQEGLWEGEATANNP